MATVAAATEIRPFAADVPQVEVDDLRRRLAETRWPDRETVPDASQGVQLAMLEELVRYWATDYDWRQAPRPGSTPCRSSRPRSTASTSTSSMSVRRTRTPCR